MLKIKLLKYLAIISGLSLIIYSLPVSPSLAATDAVKWSSVSLPTDGESGQWRLASSADARCLTMAADGTLYCYATPAGTSNTLFKSIDSGLSWHSIGGIKDAIVAIAIVPQDITTLYYATVSCVYCSNNGGNSFVSLPPNPGGTGINNIVISSLAVAKQDGGNLVVVGTKNPDVGQFGGVYILNESFPSDGWFNSNIGNYDVYNVAFPPDYLNHRILIAVAGNDAGIVVRSRITDNGWGQMIGDACLPGFTPLSATIAFTADYSEMGGFFFALDTGRNRGDVYRVTPAIAPVPSTVTPLGIGNNTFPRQIDISSLAVTGNMDMPLLIAGSARRAETYVSHDGGLHWKQGQKLPGGQSDTCVIIASDFTNQQKAYAVTCGSDSAFSVSTDGGLTWNPVSFIDTKINSLVDFTYIPNGSENDLFLITHDGTSLKYSLWRSLDAGAHWQRLFVSNPPAIDSFHLVRGTMDGGLFLAGQSYGIPVIWSSTDRGQTFFMRPAPCTVDSWTFAGGNTFFIGGYDGAKGMTYCTTNGGISYSQPVGVGMRTLSSIKLSPDFPNDRTIVAGNTGGLVFLSTDGGNSFQQLGQQLPVSAGTGKVNLAFDNNFTQNNIVYAAVDTKITTTSKERLFRFTIGQSTTWQSMYDALPEHAIINQIAVTDDGTLYAVNGQGVVIADGKGGLLRSLVPSSQPSIEVTMRGLDEAVILKGLWSHENQLWSFDMKNTLLLTFTDTLTKQVALRSPENQLSAVSTDTVLEWQTLTGATEYEWQINDQAGFSSLPAGFGGTTEISSQRLSDLKPAVTYYWRVRVVKPLHSPWSESFSFTTMLGGVDGAPVLTFPEAGSITTINPVFQWRTVSGADRYELLVSNDTEFFNPIVCCTGMQVLFSNAWLCDKNLEYDTAYFWKVRACTATNSGEWSAVSAFITERMPTKEESNNITQQQSADPPATIVSPVLPQPLTTATTIQLSIPDWALYAGLALLIIIVVLLIALVLALFSARRL